MLLYLANVVAETQVSIHRKGHQENVLWTWNSYPSNGRESWYMALTGHCNVKAHSQKDRQQVILLHEVPNHTKFEIWKWNRGIHGTGGPGWNGGGLVLNGQSFDLRKRRNVLEMNDERSSTIGRMPLKQLSWVKWLTQSVSPYVGFSFFFFFYHNRKMELESIRRRRHQWCHKTVIQKKQTKAGV